MQSNLNNLYFRAGACGYGFDPPRLCDPDGDKPCCSGTSYGVCGNSTEHCDCVGCVDNRILYREWRESRGAQKWRYDGLCGTHTPLPDGTPGQCNPDGDKPCCSNYGECGHSVEHCTCYSCTNYTFVRDWWKSGGAQKWKNDRRCGRNNPLPDGTHGQCDPDGDKPCCSSRWDGECGNTAEHCKCKDCTDYKVLYENWRESGSTQKWRYDGKCGYDYPLPDGTPGQCNPDGDKPCCSSGMNGMCDNTAEHCTCGFCADYGRIHREWRASNGTQKWRYDGRCGSKYRLPDGTPGQCNPDGDKPCCSRYGECGNTDYHCLCADCINYRVVREIQSSGKNCTAAKIHSGFLKHVCFDEDKKQLLYKCMHSNNGYTIVTSNYANVKVSKLCKNDPHFYQACLSDVVTRKTNTDVLCGGYFCKEEGLEEWRNGAYDYTNCAGNKCKSENRDCKPLRDNTKLCNDKCDDDDNCLDENYCNGHHYGTMCTWQYSDYFLRVNYVCDGDEDCNDGSDEQNCSIDGTVHTCTHYWKKMALNEELIVPIHNYTRCSVFDFDASIYPYCLNYLDQTNCSDVERVGGYCEVNGYMSSVSKYMVCYEFYPVADQPSVQLCDDGIQNKCIKPSTSDCRVHKHWMCDGVKDCPDGTDEIHDMCETMIDEQQFVCKRRFDKQKRNESIIPLSWILDNITDCMDGEDENVRRWKVCSGEIKKVLLTGESCQNFFRCPHDKTAGSISFDQLCDGLESCENGSENSVCSIARDFPNVDKVANYTDDSIRDVCRDLSITEYCEVREFVGIWSQSEVFGVDKILVNVPTSKISCTDLFGEHYLFLSCLGLCSEENSTCPLESNSKLQYDSCPGQFPDRAITLANNSFLTFVIKSERGHYHQEFYQCKNRRCIEYKKVCDLIDDCGDMSDEINCTNHMICENTKYSTRHHYISLERQKCDGIYDCFDLSDECNESCSKQILGNWVLKCTCWLMGILALVLNSFALFHGLSTIKDAQTEGMMMSKSLISLIGSGDFLIGLYLIILSVYDSIIFGTKFCRRQAEWLTGSACLTLGVISTVGSQISLFSMTAMSLIRMFGLLYRSMRISGSVNKKAVTRVVLMCSSIIFLSLAIALIPLVPSLEDYFVQGMHYDPAYKVFIGFPNKNRHIQVLEEYYRHNKTSNTSKFTSDLSWKEIGEEVDGMFTQDHGTLTRKPVHFYGNDGVCLFKYFVRTDDARRSRKDLGTKIVVRDPVVWTMLIVNLICFIIITYCYIRININTRQSTQSSGQQDNPERLRENRAIQIRIMLIVATDFMCWVPFLFISGLHNLGQIDASDWYTSFAMTVLPLNSVINPLIYDKALGKLLHDIMRKSRVEQLSEFVRGGLTSTMSSIRLELTPAETSITGLPRSRNKDHQPEIIPE